MIRTQDFFAAEKRFFAEIFKKCIWWISNGITLFETLIIVNTNFVCCVECDFGAALKKIEKENI